MTSKDIVSRVISALFLGCPGMPGANEGPALPPPATPRHTLIPHPSYMGERGHNLTLEAGGRGWSGMFKSQAPESALPGARVS